MAICASCGTNNVDGTKFCVQCGAALAPAPGAWRTPTEELNAPASGGSATPGSSPYAPPPPSSTPFQTPPPAPAVYGQQQAVAPAAYGVPMRYAEWGDRALGYLIDTGIAVGASIVLIIIFSILAALGAGLGGSDSPLPGGIFCFGTFISFLAVFGFGLYNKVFLVSKRGSSIGQNFMHLKVVDAAGNIPSTGMLVLRLLVQSGLPFVPFGAIVSLVDHLFPLWDEKKQTIHDKAASTFVVKTT
jgi:uncharacterized RDD family membrane protein YckC